MFLQGSLKSANTAHPKKDGVLAEETMCDRPTFLYPVAEGLVKNVFDAAFERCRANASSSMGIITTYPGAHEFLDLSATQLSGFEALHAPGAALETHYESDFENYESDFENYSDSDDEAKTNPVGIDSVPVGIDLLGSFPLTERSDTPEFDVPSRSSIHMSSTRRCVAAKLVNLVVENALEQFHIDDTLVDPLPPALNTAGANFTVDPDWEDHLQLLLAETLDMVTTMAAVCEKSQSAAIVVQHQVRRRANRKKKATMLVQDHRRPHQRRNERSSYPRDFSLLDPSTNPYQLVKHNKESKVARPDTASLQHAMFKWKNLTLSHGKALTVVGHGCGRNAGTSDASNGPSDAATGRITRQQCKLREAARFFVLVFNSGTKKKPILVSRGTSKRDCQRRRVSQFALVDVLVPKKRPTLVNRGTSKGECQRRRAAHVLLCDAHLSKNVPVFGSRGIRTKTQPLKADDVATYWATQTTFGRLHSGYCYFSKGECQRRRAAHVLLANYLIGAGTDVRDAQLSKNRVFSSRGIRTKTQPLEAETTVGRLHSGYCYFSKGECQRRRAAHFMLDIAQLSKKGPVLCSRGITTLGRRRTSRFLLVDVLVPKKKPALVKNRGTSKGECQRRRACAHVLLGSVEEQLSKIIFVSRGTRTKTQPLEACFPETTFGRLHSGYCYYSLKECQRRRASKNFTKKGSSDFQWFLPREEERHSISRGIKTKTQPLEIETPTQTLGRLHSGYPAATSRLASKQVASKFLLIDLRVPQKKPILPSRGTSKGECRDRKSSRLLLPSTAIWAGPPRPPGAQVPKKPVPGHGKPKNVCVFVGFPFARTRERALRGRRAWKPRHAKVGQSVNTMYPSVLANLKVHMPTKSRSNTNYSEPKTDSDGTVYVRRSVRIRAVSNADGFVELNVELPKTLTETGAASKPLVPTTAEEKGLFSYLFGY
jgi:hypothetical protein